MRKILIVENICERIPEHDRLIIAVKDTIIENYMGF